MTSLLAAAAAVTIQFVPLEKPERVNVIASNAPPGSVLTLHLAGRKKEIAPPMFAKVVRSGDDLVLTPSFDLVAGNDYDARLRRPGASTIQKRHHVPNPKIRRVPKILTIYPRAELVPANLLKFYLYFSEPMREGREIFDLIRLEDATGKAVHSPWRRQELWSDDARRLTLWIHPGRIKRGVNLREAFGPVLHPNAHYTLVIDSKMRSAAGVSLGSDHRLGFRTGPEDRERPKPKKWSIETAKANTRHPIRISAPDSLDHALLRRHQWIETAGGQRVAGTFRIEKGEHAWWFQPRTPWKAGSHSLHVDQWLEDLAGNTPTRKFERDVNDPEPSQDVTKVGFVIRQRD